jgi:hypothetical protein
LEIATHQISENVIQAREWDAKILTRPASLPYPIIYGSADEVRWGKTTKGRITVNFNGIDKYLKAVDPDIEESYKIHQENPFQLYCDAEGTVLVQQEKSDLALKNLESEKPDPRSQSTLERLKNLPDRPSKAPYRGNPEILVGLSIRLANPVTAAVVNVRTGDVLTYRTPKTLLGDRYRLLNRHRTKQQQNILQRQKNQKLGIAHQPSESELGEYVDRLLANEIIKLAQKYRADSIVIPTLTHLRVIGVWGTQRSS